MRTGWVAFAGVVLLTAAASAQAPTPAAAPNARQFTEQALAANVAEIKLGELAKGHAQSAAVKQFADMMIRDHTKAKDELKQAVKGSGIEEPTQLDTKHQALYDKLNQLNGAAFDREYMTAMVDGHKEVKDMLSTRANQPPSPKGTSGAAAGDAQLDPKVNQWASKTLPAVNQHLQKAESISQQLK